MAEDNKKGSNGYINEDLLKKVELKIEDGKKGKAIPMGHDTSMDGLKTESNNTLAPNNVIRINFAEERKKKERMREMHMDPVDKINKILRDHPEIEIAIANKDGKVFQNMQSLFGGGL